MPKDKVDEIKIPDEEVVKPPDGYTEEEWKDLSPTEREGIIDSLKKPEVGTEEELGEEEIDEDILKEIAEEGEEPEKKEPEKKEPEKKPAEPSAPEKPSEVPIPEKKVEVSPEAPAEPERLSDDDLLAFNPIVRPEEIVIETKKPPEVQDKLKAINQKYEAGEITLDERDDQREDILETWRDQKQQERESLKDSILWQKQQGFFLNNRSEYLGELGADKIFHPTSRSSSLFGALSEQLNSLNANPKYNHLPGMTLLIEADRRVKESFGTKETPKVKLPEKKTEDKDIKPPAKLPEHKTLTDIPAAAANLADDVFTQIDKLQGEAYEKALEQMTPEQRKRYEDDLRPRLRQ